MAEIWTVARNYIITAVLSAVIAFVVAKIRQLGKSQSALISGMLSLLRSEIIRAHDKYTELGYLPLYVREAIEKVYMAYTALGGNGSIKRLYEELMTLPTKERDKE